MSDETPLDGEEIRRYLLEVASAMSVDGPQHRILVVGGALLAWHGLRDTTLDVDSVHRVDEELRQAVQLVAKRHGLAPQWLNDSAAGFVPATLKVEDCDVILDEPRLLVLGAPLRQVFLMKVFAGRERDQDDLVSLWPQLGVTPEEVADEYWTAYPAAPADPFLADWIRQIAGRVG